MPQFERCPKCAHAPLPADQALPAACPACGLILAKFGARISRPEVDDEAPEGGLQSRARSLGERCIALVTHVPERVERPAFWGRVVLLVLFAAWGVRLIALDYRVGEMGESFLHRPLLVFHEAGHVLFMPFGEFVTILGGTLGQLIMPAILCGALLIQRRDVFGAAIGLWLVGVSLLDVAPYAYDALQPQLILLGGHTGAEGGHDWIYLLGRFGLIPRAHGIGWLIHKAGAALMLGALAWAAWQLAEQKKRLTDSFLLDP